MNFLHDLYCLFRDLYRGCIVERWYKVGGYQFELRFTPLVYEREVKRLGELIDDGKDQEAKQGIEQAYAKWGCDKELVRLNTIYEFMTRPFDDET